MPEVGRIISQSISYILSIILKNNNSINYDILYNNYIT